MSLRLRALDLWLRLFEKPYLGRMTDLAGGRARMERQVHLLPMPRGTRLRDGRLGPLAALWADPGPVPANAPILMWLHGGAYCAGSPRTHAAMVAALALRAGTRAVLPAYRLAPEHPFPAAPEDALAAYRALLDAGEPPARIALGGDSAGGGLAFALLHMALEAGLPPPGCLIAFSPWTDLTLSGASLRGAARTDAMLPAVRMAECRDLYLKGHDPADPRASPRFGAYQGAGPVFIQASRAEILLDDARAMAARIEDCGARVQLDLWNATPHVWQIFQARLPEADAALDRAAAFLRAYLAPADTTAPP